MTRNALHSLGLLYVCVRAVSVLWHTILRSLLYLFARTGLYYSKQHCMRPPLHLCVRDVMYHGTHRLALTAVSLCKGCVCFMTHNTLPSLLAICVRAVSITSNNSLQSLSYLCVRAVSITANSSRQSMSYLCVRLCLSRQTAVYSHCRIFV